MKDEEYYAWELDVRVRLRAGLKGDTRKLKIAFGEFAREGWQPEHLEDDIDLRDYGLVLGPILKRAILRAKWGTKCEPLIEWMLYFRKLDPAILSWAGRFVIKDASSCIEDFVLPLAHVFHRAGAVDELWKVLLLSIDLSGSVDHNSIKEIAELARKSLREAASVSSVS